MVVLSFKSSKSKEHLLEKARKMEEYASMIVDCIERCKEDDEEYSERSYRDDDEYDRHGQRYNYRRMR